MNQDTQEKQYKGWNVTKLRMNAWKAEKNGLSINTCNPQILQAMIDENESKTRYMGDKK